MGRSTLIPDVCYVFENKMRMVEDVFFVKVQTPCVSTVAEEFAQLEVILPGKVYKKEKPLKLYASKA